ncbi:MAG: bifunctional phosphopantothenoylcysteine decarboxylase/phosphopantothenate--cysteine ligase CoaBC [Armatimonadota bacterium]|nr:bifunctional phosphopantothenoylcysteine decarboxylase/phosphopantothenate--cysteine ligase CoaBC [Armatimonadota bacterium]
MAREALRGRRIVVAVTGGIAAYKACDLVSALARAGAEVRVVMTRNAQRFVGPLSFATLSGSEVSCDMWAERDDIGHISLADFAQAVIIAPATANIIGKYASGIADDLLSTALLTFDCPVIVAPAMNTRMLDSDAVQGNLRTLRERGVRVVEPEEGRLACGHVGPGRLPPTEVLLDALEESLGVGGPLSGVRVLVTAGPTREPLDPVRFISNPSSGKMGYALAEEAVRRGASAVLISGPVALPEPAGVAVTRVSTAAQMHDAVEAHAGEVDLFIGAAAVADWRPAQPSDEKLKKSGREEMTLHLTRTPDIIAGVAGWNPRPVVVGFAAETGDLLANAAQKLQEKGLDLIVANDVGRADIGFGADANEVALIDASGHQQRLPRMTKAEVARAVLDAAQVLLPRDVG